jgi:hypothetical protein
MGSIEIGLEDANWILLAHSGIQWWAVVNVIMSGTFFTSLMTVDLAWI